MKIVEMGKILGVGFELKVFAVLRLLNGVFGSKIAKIAAQLKLHKMLKLARNTKNTFLLIDFNYNMRAFIFLYIIL